MTTHVAVGYSAGQNLYTNFSCDDFASGIVGALKNYGNLATGFQFSTSTSDPQPINQFAAGVVASLLKGPAGIALLGVGKGLLTASAPAGDLGLQNAFIWVGNKVFVYRAEMPVDSVC